MSAKRYVPFDRSIDIIEDFPGDDDARDAYLKCANGNAGLINETVKAMRKLRPPVKSRITTVSDGSRLDPRQAYKVGMALKGAQGVDLSRPWLDQKEKPERKFAVE